MAERGTGLTKAMVTALPPEGGHIIVHTGALRSYVRSMIRDVRGRDVLRATTVHVVRYVGDHHKLAGLTGHIAVDHAFYDEAPDRLSRAVQMMIDGARASGADKL